ncbi:MAG: T9SS type A sorting domain-containing protein, partial [Bacteroidota bacterium]
RVFFNPYGTNEVWVASWGNGFRAGVNLMTGNPLPVEMVSFTGYNKNKCNYLNWQTASEIQNLKFEVERSEDTKNFFKIGEVSGHSNSSSTNSYSFTDADVPLGINYYRLKQINFNGNEEYSAIISIRNPSTGTDFEVFPVPFSDEIIIHVFSNSNQPVEIKVFDVFGREIISQPIVTSNTKFKTSGWKSGIYFLKTTDTIIKIVKE